MTCFVLILLATQAATVTTHNKLISSAKNVLQINVDAATRRLTKENLHNPDTSTFDIAQSKVLTLMEKDSFRRFLCQTKTDQEKRKNSSIVQLKAISQKVSAFCTSSTSKKTKKCDENDSTTKNDYYLSPIVTNFAKSMEPRQRVFTMWFYTIRMQLGFLKENARK